MPKRLVSWGVLLFSMAMTLVAYQTEAAPGFAYDPKYHVITLNITNLGYWIMGAISGALSLFLVVSAFWTNWSDSIEKFILDKLHALLFTVYWIAYILGYLKGIGSLVQASRPAAIVDVAFYVGFALFLLIPIHYFKWQIERIREARAARQQHAV